MTEGFIIARSEASYLSLRAVAKRSRIFEIATGSPTESPRNDKKGNCHGLSKGALASMGMGFYNR